MTDHKHNDKITEGSFVLAAGGLTGGLNASVTTVVFFIRILCYTSDIKRKFTVGLG